MTQQKPLRFTTRIKSLNMISCNIDEKPKSLKIDDKKITFAIGLSIKIDAKEKCVTISNPIEIFSDTTKTIRLGAIEPKAEFIIENFDEIKVNENEVPLSIVATYVGIVISSARGMLSLISKGTAFEKAIIPIVNPTELLQNAMQLKSKAS